MNSNHGISSYIVASHIHTETTYERGSWAVMFQLYEDKTPANKIVMNIEWDPKKAKCQKAWSLI